MTLSSPWAESGRVSCERASFRRGEDAPIATAAATRRALVRARARCVEEVEFKGFGFILEVWAVAGEPEVWFGIVKLLNPGKNAPTCDRRPAKRFPRSRVSQERSYTPHELAVLW